MAQCKCTLNGLVHLDFGLTESAPGVWKGDHVQIDPTAQIGSPVALGHNVTVGAGASLGANDGENVKAIVNLDAAQR